MSDLMINSNSQFRIRYSHSKSIELRSQDVNEYPELFFKISVLGADHGPTMRLPAIGLTLRCYNSQSTSNSKMELWITERAKRIN